MWLIELNNIGKVPKAWVSITKKYCYKHFLWWIIFIFIFIYHPFCTHFYSNKAPITVFCSRKIDLYVLRCDIVSLTMVNKQTNKQTYGHVMWLELLEWCSRNLLKQAKKCRFQDAQSINMFAVNSSDHGCTTRKNGDDDEMTKQSMCHKWDLLTCPLMRCHHGTWRCSSRRRRQLIITQQRNGCNHHQQQ